MKAIRYYAPGDIRIEDLPKPEPKEGEALIKVLYGGICGSDLHNYSLGMFMTYSPETIGHEFVGIIEEAPEGSDLQPGDMVTGNPAVVCGECPSCLKGDYMHCQNIGFMGEVCSGADAEYTTYDASKLIRIKDSVDPIEAAIIEPLTVAYHTCKMTEPYLTGSDVAVFGAGTIGVLVAYLLENLFNVPKVVLVDVNKNRVSAAKEAGFKYVGKSIDEFPGEYATVIDTTGSGPALASEMDILPIKGTLVVMSIFEKIPEINLNVLVDKEIKIAGSTLYTHEEMKEVAKIVESGEYNFRWLVTKIADPCDAPKVFRELRENRSDLKILFDFT